MKRADLRQEIRYLSRFNKGRYIVSLLLIVALVGLSCTSSENPSPSIPEDNGKYSDAVDTDSGNQSNRRITITNDEDSLKHRLITTDRQVPIEAVSEIAKRSALIKPDAIQASFAFSLSTSQPNSGNPLSTSLLAAKSVKLNLVAEVEPPNVGGQVLQASSVVISGKYAYVSYNMRGDQAIGAIDVIDIKDAKKPKLVSQAIFLDSDVHSLTYGKDKIYASEATSDSEFSNPAVLEVIKVHKGKLTLKDNKRVQLPSFAGTSVAYAGKDIFVTSGDTGGLSVFGKDGSDLKKTIDLHDARWVSIEDKWIVVVQGTPGQISVFEKGKMKLVNSFPFGGAEIPESKSTVQVIGGKAIIAAGTGGLQVLSIHTGKVLGTVPQPILTGVDSLLTVTNSASADGDLIFISNGGAGVYVARANGKLDKAPSEDQLDLELLGKLKFQDLLSVNHVEYKDKVLFVAAGLGGLKILTIKD